VQKPKIFFEGLKSDLDVKLNELNVWISRIRSDIRGFIALRSKLRKLGLVREEMLILYQVTR
jgi:hypothetical protein